MWDVFSPNCFSLYQRSSLVALASCVALFFLGGCFTSFDSNSDPKNSTHADSTSSISNENADNGETSFGTSPSNPLAGDNDDLERLDPGESRISYCEEAKEKELVVLECGSGVIDSIDFASFGKYEGSCEDGDAAIGKCHYEETIDVIMAECLGKSRCQLIADKKEVFGDPCRDPRLIVEYTCLYQGVCPDGSLKTAPGKCGCNKSDYDRDGDGSANCNDECDNNPEKIFSGVCGCDVEEVDHDEDGSPSCVDECDKDPNKTEPGICGCDKPDEDLGDSDGDGTINCRDDCPDDPNKVKKGICGCGKVDDPTDSDNDGTADCADECPYDPLKRDAGHCDCGSPEICDGYCEDTPHYKDPKGESCKYWKERNCLLPLFYGYTAAQGQQIQRYCHKSCGLCP